MVLRLAYAMGQAQGRTIALQPADQEHEALGQGVLHRPAHTKTATENHPERSMTVDTDNLKALALAATPGKWRREDRTIYVLEHDVWRKGVEQFSNRFSCSVSRDGSQIPPEELLANAEWIAAANPATVLELIAEVERLRADAGRYQWLRDKANDERSRAPMVFNCHPEDVISWTDSLHGAKLDAVLDVFIDAAIEKEKA
jgi:hypothetical protein